MSVIKKAAHFFLLFMNYERKTVKTGSLMSCNLSE